MIKYGCLTFETYGGVIVNLVEENCKMDNSAIVFDRVLGKNSMSSYFISMMKDDISMDFKELFGVQRRTVLSWDWDVYHNHIRLKYGTECSFVEISYAINGEFAGTIKYCWKNITAGITRIHESDFDLKKIKRWIQFIDEADIGNTRRILNEKKDYSRYTKKKRSYELEIIHIQYPDIQFELLFKEDLNLEPESVYRQIVDKILYYNEYRTDGSIGVIHDVGYLRITDRGIGFGVDLGSSGEGGINHVLQVFHDLGNLKKVIIG